MNTFDYANLVARLRESVISLLLDAADTIEHFQAVAQLMEASAENATSEVMLTLFRAIADGALGTLRPSELEAKRGNVMASLLKLNTLLANETHEAIESLIASIAPLKAAVTQRISNRLEQLRAEPLSGQSK